MNTELVNVVRDALWGYGYYIDRRTGMFLPFDVASSVPLSQRLSVPRLSHAHVRQIFITSKKISEEELAEYDLIGYSKFPLQSNDRYYPNAARYIRNVHIYNEDHQIEDEFWGFYDAYTLPIAKDWCEKNEIPYTE